MASVKGLGYQPKDRKPSPFEEAIKRRMEAKKAAMKDQTPDVKNVQNSKTDEPEEVKKRKKVGY